jgi:hypothetical protein
MQGQGWEKALTEPNTQAQMKINRSVAFILKFFWLKREVDGESFEKAFPVRNKGIF